jgi:2-polyprenyl-6-methoxyphenol hydroxylase-like FAD-dependent oxidoreductase
VSGGEGLSLKTGEAPVLIAGGGMIGLSAAMFLAQQGIASLAVERLKESSPLPRAAFFHMRTLEMFRSAGIEGRVRARSLEDFVPEGAIIVMDRVAGKKLADIIPSLNEGVDALSPCRRLFLNQPSLEPILRDRAREAGAQVMQGAEVIGVEQDAREVALKVKDVDTGAEQTLRGKYLIAADGAHSKIRELTGIPYVGRGVFSNSITIYFTADLSPWIADNAWSIIYVNNPVLGGFFRMDRASSRGFLVVNTVGDPKADPIKAADAARDINEEKLVGYVRAGVGVSDLKVKIEGVARWRATADVARKFRDGRIFIAGDAAHLMPPNGGFGGNTGIHDAHNLAWKLALVLKGVADEKLLGSYETERMPVAKFTVEQAFARYVTRTAPWLTATQKTEPVVNDFNIEIGYLYRSPAVIAEPGSPLGHADPRETFGLPGSRAPHLWLKRRGKDISTIDLIGNFLLLAGADGADWVSAATKAAAALRLPFDAYCVGRELEDPHKRFTQAYGVSPSGAALIRPDGFVAWRAKDMAPSPENILRDVLERILLLKP